LYCLNTGPSKHFCQANSWTMCGLYKISLVDVWMAHGYGILGAGHTLPKCGAPDKINSTYGICVART
jgi:hypothetical protein